MLAFFMARKTNRKTRGSLLELECDKTLVLIKHFYVGDKVYASEKAYVRESFMLGEILTPKVSITRQKAPLI